MNTFEMKQYAYESTLKSRALQVLIYLIDRSNKEMTCFPSIPTVARELHISISTVKRAMQELLSGGFVKKESRFRQNNGQTSNLYTLLIPEKVSEDKHLDGISASEECVLDDVAEDNVCLTAKNKERSLDSVDGGVESVVLEQEQEKGGFFCSGWNKLGEIIRDNNKCLSKFRESIEIFIKSYIEGYVKGRKIKLLSRVGERGRGSFWSSQE